MKTTQNPGESIAAFYARHAQRVANARADCPGEFDEGAAEGSTQVRCAEGGPWIPVAYTQLSTEDYPQFTVSFEAKINAACAA